MRVAIASAFPLLLAFPPTICRAEAPGPPVQTVSSEGGPRHSRIQVYLRLPATYTLLMGSEFDGRHVYHFDSQRSAYLPKLSGGFGLRPAAGVQFNRVLPALSLSTALSFENSKHQAISYNVGNSWYEHDDAKYFNLGLELRGILELGRFKPFIGITPAYGWLSLPNGITVIDANRVVSWSDLTLRGFSLEATVGLLYQFLPSFALDAAFTFREARLTSSGSGSLNGYGFSAAMGGALGAIFLL